MAVGIAPLSFDRINYAYRSWKIEANIGMKFVQNKLERQEISVRLQALPYSGEYYKTSVSIGIIEYTSIISTTDTKLLKPKYSPTISGLVAVPHWYRSYISMHADYKSLSLGINTFAFYENFSDRLSLLGQIDHYVDDNYKNRFGEQTIFSAGIRFKTMDNLHVSLSYEAHELFIMKLNYEF